MGTVMRSMMILYCNERSQAIACIPYMRAFISFKLHILLSHGFKWRNAEGAFVLRL